MNFCCLEPSDLWRTASSAEWVETFRSKAGRDVQGGEEEIQQETFSWSRAASVGFPVLLGGVEWEHDSFGHRKKRLQLWLFI